MERQTTNIVFIETDEDDGLCWPYVNMRDVLAWLEGSRENTVRRLLESTGIANRVVSGELRMVAHLAATFEVMVKDAEAQHDEEFHSDEVEEEERLDKGAQNLLDRLGINYGGKEDH